MVIEKQNSNITISEVKKQQQYMQKMKAFLWDWEQKTGQKQSYFVLTTGCQMNAHDSEKLAGMLETMGYVKSPTDENADFVIYNTCCIRENAEEKVYGRLGRLKYYKKQNKNMKIALCGCMTQQDVVIEKLQKSYKFIDIVFGTFNLYKLPELLYHSMQTEGTLFDIWKEAGEIVEDIPTMYQSAFQASVNVTYGCENFCSYCIVPYVRGKERSRKPEDILHEVEQLAQNGIKEIMLLGQNVNSYGKNLEHPLSFAKLLQKINQVEGIERIRFMTSHPKDLSDELIETIKNCKKVCNYIHLPIQSGSSEILKRMNRRYTKEQYLELVQKLKNAIPDITISTDIIVGFPGETEQDFQETLDVIRQVKYCTAFTFIYSKRTGTPAAKMEQQVPEEVVKDRFNRLLQVLNPIVEEVHQKQVGTIANVLVEEVSKQNSAILTGRMENNILVHFEGNKDCIGKILPIKITDNKTFYVIGERIG